MEVRLESIRNSIENMNKLQNVEVLKILKVNNVKLNENKNGIYINMSYLSESIVDKLDDYVKYVNRQEQLIKTFEYQTDEFKNILSPVVHPTITINCIDSSVK
jgi:DNA-binding cell septation regulator SpoVG